MPTEITLDPLVLSGRLNSDASDADKLAATVSAYQSQAISAASALLNTYQTCHRLFYANKHGLTPQRITAGIGNESALLMRKHAIAIKSLLLFVSPGVADQPWFDDGIPTFDVAEALPENLFPG